MKWVLPEHKIEKSPGVSLTVTQHQNQTQEIAISIYIDSIKDELTGRQMNEIKEIHIKQYSYLILLQYYHHPHRLIPINQSEGYGASCFIGWFPWIHLSCYRDGI